LRLDNKLKLGGLCVRAKAIDLTAASRMREQSREKEHKTFARAMAGRTYRGADLCRTCHWKRSFEGLNLNFLRFIRAQSLNVIYKVTRLTMNKFAR
jgi:hypothetical protein